MKQIFTLASVQTKSGFEGAAILIFKACLALLMLLSMAVQTLANAPKSRPAAPPPSCPMISVDGNPNDWPAALNTVSLTKKAFQRDAFQANGNDDQWTGGSQDNDVNISSEWSWVLGNSNDKGDIANAGLFICNGVLYFFGDRAAINGDAQIGLWLFKDNVQKTGTGIRASGFTGSHQNGDLLIISNFTNGGGTSVPTIYVWNNGAPQLICSGITCPPGAGLITTNSSTVASPSGTTMYNGQIWNFRAKGSPAGNTDYLKNLFFEGMIDLNLLSTNYSIPLSGGCYQRFLMETRNSQSITASLQDLVTGGFSGLPGPPVINSDTICEGATDAALVANCGGTDVNWFDSPTATTPVYTGNPFNPSGSSSFVPGVYTYYASCVDGQCESTRTPATLTVFGSPSPIIIVDNGAPLPDCSVGYSYQLGVTVDAVLNNSNYNYSWSATPSGGSFSCTTCPNPTFSSSVSGSYTLTVVVTSKSAPYCSGQAQFTVTVSSCGGHIFPTNTTCCNYLGGATLTFDLEQICTTVSGSRVSNAIPGVFFYYGSYTATSTGSVTLTVQQSRNCPSNILKAFDPQNSSNVRVYVDNCVTIAPSSVSISQGNASVTFNAVAGKTYVISVKYDSKSILNSSASSGPVTYSFAMYQASTLISNTAGSLNVVQGCSDNTPLASGSCPSARGLAVTPQQTSVVASTLTVEAYPNPYVNAITFNFVSPAAGTAILEIFDGTGAKLTTILKRNIGAGTKEQIRYRVPADICRDLYYRLTVNDQSARGVVVCGR